LSPEQVGTAMGTPITNAAEMNEGLVGKTLLEAIKEAPLDALTHIQNHYGPATFEF
ncbi:MAG: hypothetical protein JWO35_344, partial [Candidatus Saccharibacteria bacterium]|nr:hypothetical protein [Candidatus Saccharibacteria bacterium]